MIDAKPRRRFILTKQVMGGIPVLVSKVSSKPSQPLGCKVGTFNPLLASLSLRVPKEVNVVAMVPLAPASGAKKKQSGHMPLPCRLHCNSTKSRCPAAPAAEAIGMTESEFVTKLLEAIAQHDLFDAVLDNGKGAA